MYQKINICVNENTFFTNKLAIELAHLIGFKSVAMEFPLVVFDKNLPDDTLCFFITESLSEGFKVEPVDNNIIISISPTESAVQQAYEYLRENFAALTDDFQSGSHESAAPADFLATKNVPIDPFDKRFNKGLESLFDKDYLLLDDNDDLLPDRLDAKILLSDAYTKEQLAAACHIAARLGLETTVASYPLTCTTENCNNLFVFRDGTECGLFLEEKNGQRRFVMVGNGQDLLDFSATFCETFPLQKPGRRWLDILNELTDGLCMRTVDGQLAYIDHLQNKITADTSCYFSPKIHEVDESILANYAPARFQG